MAKNRKRPKTLESPTALKEAKAKSTDFEGETVAWRFKIVDLDGPWGWKEKAKNDWWPKIFPKLQGYDSMTWAEITRGTGGKSRGNNNHFVPVAKLAKEAKVRLREIRQEDVSDLFSLHIDGKTRIYGIRDGRALKLLWYDPDHTVYPMTKK